MKNIHGIVWENLKWGFVDRDDFILGPNGHGQLANPYLRRVLTVSDTIDANSSLVSIIEKKNLEYMTKSSGRF